MGQDYRRGIGAGAEEGGLAEGQDPGEAPEQVHGHRENGEDHRARQHVDREAAKEHRADQHESYNFV